MPKNISAQHIAQRFAKAYDSYRGAALVQAQMADKLVAQLVGFGGTHYDTVLEIGCGSGLLSEKFAHHCTANTLILNDLYEHIKDNPRYMAQADYHYLIGDISTQSLLDTVDLVLSGASLQWIYPLDNLINKLYHSSRQGAILAFSTFGVNNLSEIRQLTGQGLSYYTKDTLAECVAAQGWQIELVDEWRQVLYFEHPMAVLRHLKATGVTATGDGFHWTRAALEEFYQAYQSLSTDQGVPLTYHPMMVIARK